MQHPKDLWNNRYEAEAFAYGEQPNVYLQTQIDKYPAARILFPAEGEGRNAVYAASKGWAVEACDWSLAGQTKALGLAAKKGVNIQYRVGDLADLSYPIADFDAIGLIYAHFLPAQKQAYHQLLDTYLRVGGLIFFEAFSKKHPEYQQNYPNIGGPKDPDMLFSLQEIESFFPNYAFLECEETSVELSEGIYHNGVGAVLRFVAQKKYAL
jgi:hypothetical protein